MRIESFSASPDLCGGRIVLRWAFVAEPGEVVPDLPAVTIRRKIRDFTFPARPAIGADPYLLYDSSAFPPTGGGDLTAHELPQTDWVDGPQRVYEQTCTIARTERGEQVEVLRRVTRTVLSADRALIRREIELLDAGDDLDTAVCYYYQLESPLPADQPTVLRATAAPGAVYRYGHSLYGLLPAVYRRYDTVTRPRDELSDWLPEAVGSAGQLRRFIDVLGAALGALRSSADGLRSLHNVAGVDYQYLPLLAQWIGWQLTPDDDVDRQRNEIAAAPQLYDSVGTIPGLRGIVDHYTGWPTRVAEHAQHIALSNTVAQRNIFAAVEGAQGWSGADDAATLLGFDSDAATARGDRNGAAQLTGTRTEPFALTSGKTLTIAVDGGLPATVVFGADDFADIGQATAAEFAAVIDSAITDLHTEAVAGALRLTSRLDGPESQVEVVTTPASLVSLDGAPTGRLGTAVDARGVGWLLYASTCGSEPAQPHLQAKAQLDGRWYDSRDVQPAAPAPAGDPAVVALPDGRLWMAWTDHPATRLARLRWRYGTPAAFSAAVLHGNAVGPFPLRAGATLTLTGFGGTQTFTVRAGDYANPDAATAAEVAVAINAQLTAVSAAAAADGSLVLTTSARGPNVALRVDAVHSTTAWPLGFGDRNLVGRGGWSASMDWADAHDVESVPAGRHAECTAVLDDDAAVRLAWSTHTGGIWRVVRVRWDGRILAAAGAGCIIRGGDGAWTVLAGLPSEDIRDVAVDADGGVWCATAAGAALRALDGTVQVLSTATTGGGVASDDVRSVGVAPDGGIVLATPAGVSIRAADGTWSTVTDQPGPVGLPSRDTRHVAVAADGRIAAATAAGISVRDGVGSWRIYRTADGLPSNDVRHLTWAADGTLVAATAAGVAVIADHTVSALTFAALAPTADDVRAVDVAAAPPAASPDPPAVTVWAATAAGLVEWRAAGDCRLYGIPDGLPADDCQSVLVDSGGVWVGTAAGLAAPTEGTRWAAVGGALAAPVRRLHGTWSAPLWFADPGGGEREPDLLRNGATVLMATSRRALDANTDNRTIALRSLALPSRAWSAVTELTAAPDAKPCADRQPTLATTPDGATRVVFSSTRVSGGTRLWSVEAADLAAPGAPTPVTTGPSADTHPALLTVPGRPSLLLFRSDRNVAMARLGGGVPAPDEADRSRRAPAEASLRRFAGTHTVVLDDLDRNRGRRRFDDLLNYTPQRPLGDAPEPDELYTPGTIGLYVERGPAGRPLVDRDAQRLRQLLASFLPANLRAVVVLSSEQLDETVFGAEHPLLESYSDQYPFAEYLAAPMDDTAVGTPDWRVFLSTDATSRTVDPTTAAPLGHRTWWPPLR